jgi:Xaa-Pro aminopeptidase
MIADREHLDGFIASTVANVAYATGFGCDSTFQGMDADFAVMPVARPKVRGLVIPMCPLDQAADLDLQDVDITTYGHFYWDREPNAELEPQDQVILRGAAHPRPDVNEIDALVEVIKSFGLDRGTLAIDEKGLGAEQFGRLQAALPDVKWQMGYKWFREMRAVKMPQEVERIRTVVQITERAIHAALMAAHEGITELEMLRVLTGEMAKHDAVPVLFTVGFGPKSAHPNSLATDRPLRRGDIIRLDVGARRLLYHSDLARMGTLGDPSEKTSRYYDALLAGQQAALDLIKPGVQVAELFNAAVKAVRAAGVPHYTRHHVGHGIGAEFYDEPIITARSDTIVEEGMVINIETPYYELGFGGLQTEDTILVTRDGFEFLTSGERPLYKV